MSQIDTEDDVLSETEEQADNVRLVPVGESIRYRKRAQNAEKKTEMLTEALTEAQTKAAAMAKKLEGIQLEQKLTRKLVGAGTVDLEAALLIAQAKMAGKTEAELDTVLEQLKKEKQYLFAEQSAAVSKRTAGVKSRSGAGQTILEKTARRAAKSGSRTDLQEYLKLRRNFL